MMGRAVLDKDVRRTSYKSARDASVMLQKFLNIKLRANPFNSSYISTRLRIDGSTQWAILTHTPQGSV
jgi:hypothetical protein